jgi:hypothetical protein
MFDASGIEECAGGRDTETVEALCLYDGPGAGSVEYQDQQSIKLNGVGCAAGLTKSARPSVDVRPGSPGLRGL